MHLRCSAATRHALSFAEDENALGLLCQYMLLQALTPQMTENKKRVEELLREALILQAALESETEAGLLERLLPKRYKQYQKGISSRA